MVAWIGVVCWHLIMNAGSVVPLQGKFGKPQGINSVCIYGGESKWLQVSAMNRTRPQLIIATPGRLNDMCSARKISLKKVGILVRARLLECWDLAH